ncbi:hypothetical protein IQ65_05625 [Leptospira interrogans serovar Lai]|nr:hypothetical protein IQ65_05625 [Leptospira interrogans serovar Lai]
MIYLNRQSLSMIQIQTKIYSDLSSRGKDLGPFLLSVLFRQNFYIDFIFRFDTTSVIFPDFARIVIF